MSDQLHVTADIFCCIFPHLLYIESGSNVDHYGLGVAHFAWHEKVLWWLRREAEGKRESEGGSEKDMELVIGTRMSVPSFSGRTLLAASLERMYPWVACLSELRPT